MILLKTSENTYRVVVVVVAAILFSVFEHNLKVGVRYSKAEIQGLDF